MKPTLFFFRLPASLLALGLLAFTTGCPTLDRGGAQTFSTGVTAARAQTKTTFDAVVGLTRTSSIEYAVKQDKLTEEELVAVPNSEAVAAWNEALDPVESYAQHLASLVTADSAKGVEDSVGKLAAQFNTTSADLKSKTNLGDAGQIAAGPASVFAEVASALLRMHAQKEAVAVAAQTDPEIRKVFTVLADAIGADQTGPGLRATVRANWAQRLAEQQVKFLKAGTPDARRPVVNDYIDLLNKRDAQDELLAALRRTYLTLADAHTALAKGQATDLGSAIDFVKAESKHARDLQDQFTKSLTK